MPYVSRPRAIVLDGWNNDLSVTAHEMIITDDSPVPVGLVDAHGHPIYRIAERVPIGFQAPKQSK